MGSDLEICVVIQYNKDISIESDIPIPLASNCRVYRAFFLWGYFDISHALSLNVGRCPERRQRFTQSIVFYHLKVFLEFEF